MIRRSPAAMKSSGSLTATFAPPRRRQRPRFPESVRRVSMNGITSATWPRPATRARREEVLLQAPFRLAAPRHRRSRHRTSKGPKHRTPPPLHAHREILVAAQPRRRDQPGRRATRLRPGHAATAARRGQLLRRPASPRAQPPGCYGTSRTGTTSSSGNPSKLVRSSQVPDMYRYTGRTRYHPPPPAVTGAAAAPPRPWAGIQGKQVDHQAIGRRQVAIDNSQEHIHRALARRIGRSPHRHRPGSPAAGERGGGVRRGRHGGGRIAVALAPPRRTPTCDSTNATRAIAQTVARRDILLAGALLAGALVAGA